MADFVLVHGAWHGGWCWSRLAGRLHAEGHRVFTPTLTGLGERAHLMHPDVGLEVHVEDVRAVIATEELSDVVLVGHSYGGAVVTAVADRDPAALSALVFLDAYIAADGVSLLDADPPERREAIVSRIVETAQGPILGPPPAIIYGLADPDDVAWVDRRQTPHPIRTYMDAIAVTGAWRQVPRLVYIATTNFAQPDFRAISASLAGDPAFTRAEIATGHDAMIDDPDGLRALLVDHVL